MPLSVVAPLPGHSRSIPGTEWLLAAPQFEQVIIGEDGLPLRIVVPEPRTFALHKLWVSHRDDRSPLKRPRDVAHARLVADLVKTYLRLSLTGKAMPWLPKELRAMLKELKGAPIKADQRDDP